MAQHTVRTTAPSLGHKYGIKAKKEQEAKVPCIIDQVLGHRIEISGCAAVATKWANGIFLVQHVAKRHRRANQESVSMAPLFQSNLGYPA